MAPVPVFSARIGHKLGTHTSIRYGLSNQHGSACASKCLAVVDSVPIRLDYCLEAAETWASVLADLKVSTIVEILSGWAPKVALALARCSFTGRLFAVDRDPEALNALRTQVEPLLLSFDIQTVTADIFDDHLPSGDLLIANHIFDDLLVAQRSAPTNIATGDGLAAAYRDSPRVSERELRRLASQLASAVERTTKPNGLLLATHYEGYQERLFGLHDLRRQSLELKDELARLLMARGWVKEATPGRLGQMQTPYFTSLDVLTLRGP